MLFFFFFQAEDGIRDHCVTGVQTCALPISCGLRGWGCARGGAAPCPTARVRASRNSPLVSRRSRLLIVIAVPPVVGCLQSLLHAGERLELGKKDRSITDDHDRHSIGSQV